VGSLWFAIRTEKERLAEGRRPGSWLQLRSWGSLRASGLEEDVREHRGDGEKGGKLADHVSSGKVATSGNRPAARKWGLQRPDASGDALDRAATMNGKVNGKER